MRNEEKAFSGLAVTAGGACIQLKCASVQLGNTFSALASSVGAEGEMCGFFLNDDINSLTYSSSLNIALF